MNEVVLNLRKFACETLLTEEQLTTAIEELSSIFRLNRLEEDFILYGGR